MKKFKWLAVIAALAMLLGAVACSDGDADDDKHIANTASTTTSSSSFDNSSEDTNTEAESDTEGTEKGDDTDSTDETGEDTSSDGDSTSDDDDGTSESTSSSSSSSSTDNTSDSDNSDGDTSSDTSDDTTAVEVIKDGDFVLVKGTTITGTEEISPSSSVFISGRSFTIADFYMCDHEVTQAEYEEYCEYGEDKPSLTYGVGTNYPAYYVSYYDALVYCNRRSMAEELNPCYTISGSTDPDDWGDIPADSDDTWNAAECNFNANGYRLPTEAEWEYAARGGSSWDNYTYSGSDTVDDVAWYKSNSSSTTHEMKGKKENSLGLYDMSGNVCELCYDWYGSITTETASTGSVSGSWRIARGGSWSCSESNTTVSYRGFLINPYIRGNNLGFRVVRTAN